MVEPRRITLNAAGLRFGALTMGASTDPVVVCLHGFPDGPDTFRQQFEPLAAAGHRVIAPSLRGYEPSSQPADGDYSLVTLADDVVGWLDDLGVERAHLVGHDWGAAVAYVAGSRHPERFATVTSMAIPPLSRIPQAIRGVPRQLARSWYMNFFQLPMVSESAFRSRDWWLLRRLWRTWSPDHRMGADEWSELRTQFEQPGVVEAALAYYRQNATPTILLGLRSTPAMTLTEISQPTLIVHGSDDGCMDRRLFEAAVHPGDFPAGVERLEVEGAGHFVHLERPDLVNEALLQHFTR